MEDESKSFICGDFKPPKVLADIVESIAAAVFVDSGRSADRVWEVFRPLLEPLISLEKLELHPVTELTQLCQKQAKHIEYKASMKGDTIRVMAVIDGNVVGIAERQKKVLAKRMAAKQALGKLKMKDKVEKGSGDENLQNKVLAKRLAVKQALGKLKMKGSSDENLQKKVLAKRVAAKQALGKLKMKDKIEKGGIDENQNASHEHPLIGQTNLNNLCRKRHWPSPDYKYDFFHSAFPFNSTTIFIFHFSTNFYWPYLI